MAISWDPEDVVVAPDLPPHPTPQAEDAAVALIRARGLAGRAEYGATVDRPDLAPSRWLAEHQAELADALVYSVRLSDALELLETAHALLADAEFTAARAWLNAYRTRFPAP